MNFDADECLVTAMFDKGNRNDTMEAKVSNFERCNFRYNE